MSTPTPDLTMVDPSRTVAQVAQDAVERLSGEFGQDAAITHLIAHLQSLQAPSQSHQAKQYTVRFRIEEKEDCGIIQKTLDEHAPGLFGDSAISDLNSVASAEVKGGMLCVHFRKEESYHWLRHNPAKIEQLFKCQSETPLRLIPETYHLCLLGFKSQLDANGRPIRTLPKSVLDSAIKANGLGHEIKKVQQSCGLWILHLKSESDALHLAKKGEMSLDNNFRVKVRPIEVRSLFVFCFKCHGPGHKQRECISKEAFCGNCAEEKHTRKGETCNRIQRCINCRDEFGNPQAGHCAWQDRCRFPKTVEMRAKALSMRLADPWWWHSSDQQTPTNMNKTVSQALELPTAAEDAYSPSGDDRTDMIQPTQSHHTQSHPTQSHPTRSYPTRSCPTQSYPPQSPPTWSPRSPPTRSPLTRSPPDLPPPMWSPSAPIWPPLTGTPPPRSPPPQSPPTLSPQSLPTLSPPWSPPPQSSPTLSPQSPPPRSPPTSSRPPRQSTRFQPTCMRSQPTRPQPTRSQPTRSQPTRSQPTNTSLLQSTAHVSSEKNGKGESPHSPGQAISDVDGAQSMQAHQPLALDVSPKDNESYNESSNDACASDPCTTANNSNEVPLLSTPAREDLPPPQDSQGSNDDSSPSYCTTTVDTEEVGLLSAPTGANLLTRQETDRANDACTPNHGTTTHNSKGVGTLGAVEKSPEALPPTISPRGSALEEPAPLLGLPRVGEETSGTQNSQKPTSSTASARTRQTTLTWGLKLNRAQKTPEPQSPGPSNARTSRPGAESRPSCDKPPSSSQYMPSEAHEDCITVQLLPEVTGTTKRGSVGQLRLEGSTRAAKRKATDALLSKATRRKITR